MKNHVKQAIKLGEKGWEPIPLAILRESRLTSAEKNLLCVLLSFGSKVCPSQATLSEFSGLDEKSIHKALHGESRKQFQARVSKAAEANKPVPAADDAGGLVGIGAVIVHKRSGTSQSYEIIHHSKWKPEFRQKRADRGPAIKAAAAARQKARRERKAQEEREAFLAASRAATDAAAKEREAELDEERRRNYLDGSYDVEARANWLKCGGRV